MEALRWLLYDINYTLFYLCWMLFHCQSFSWNLCVRIFRIRGFKIHVCRQSQTLFRLENESRQTQTYLRRWKQIQTQYRQSKMCRDKLTLFRLLRMRRNQLIHCSDCRKCDHTYSWSVKTVSRQSWNTLRQSRSTSRIIQTFLKIISDNVEK